MQGQVSVSGAVVTYNCADKAVNAVKTVVENTKKYPFKLYVFDNASSDGTVDAIGQIDDVTVKNSGGNIGFGKAHNLALGEEMGKYHAVINPDVLLDYDCISALVDRMEADSSIVMITPRVLNEDGSEQKLPKLRPTFKRLFLGRLSKKIRSEYTMADKELSGLVDISFCTGCFFVIRSDVFKALGGFDKDYFMYLEDADLTLKAKQYGRVVLDCDNHITHLWERESAKSLKYLLIHIKSAFTFFKKRRKDKL